MPPSGLGGFRSWHVATEQANGKIVKKWRIRDLIENEISVAIEPSPEGRMEHTDERQREGKEKMTEAETPVFRKWDFV